MGVQGMDVVMGSGEIQLTVRVAHFETLPDQGDATAFGFRPRAARLGHAGYCLTNRRFVLSEHMEAEKLLHFEWNDQAVRVLTQDRAPPADASCDVAFEL